MIKGLDAFRAFAFFTVFLFHLNILDCGYLGVDAFFVLSGFLITPILIALKQNNTLGNYLKTFYGRRALRIFPLYYAYLLGFILIVFLFKQNDDYYTRIASQLPYALTYTYDFLHTTRYYFHNYFTTHFWSLAVEEQFYLVWPFIIFFIKEKHLKTLMICIMIAGLFIRYFTFKLPLLPNFNFLNDGDVVVYVSPFSYVDAFIMGAFASVYGNKIKVNKRIIAALFAGIIILGCITSKFVLGNYHFNAIGYSPFMNDAQKHLWGYTAFAIFFSFILIALKRRIFFPAIFENKIISYLGKISYGLYVFHFPVIYLCSGIWYDNIVFLFISSLLFTILLSVLSFELYEKRINKLKDKFFRYKQANSIALNQNPASLKTEKQMQEKIIFVDKHSC